MSFSPSTRRFFGTAALIAVVTVTSGSPVLAQNLVGASLKSLLADACDRTLDRLARPGAFSSDQAVRIALPGPGGDGRGGGAMNQLMDLAQRSGAMADIDAAINRAAEQAAGQAKPIFRAAIDRVSWQDAAAMARSATGATDYLRGQTQSQIQAQILPLVHSALQQSGVLRQSSALAAIGMNETRLAGYVADRTTEGIFTYVGREETRARQDPLGTGRQLLKGFGF